MEFFLRLLGYLARAVFSLRYRVHIEAKNLNFQKGMLFLPNHTALLDPALFLLYFWPRFRMRPLVVEYIYRKKFLRPIFRIIKAISIPNFDNGSNEYKRLKGQESLRQIIEGLKRGENFLLYPSGRLKKSGREIVGGGSSVYSILHECPETQIVLVRTTGFWGSRFSRALTGDIPDLNSNLLSGIKTAMKNLIFFMPRRKITIEIESAPSDFPVSGTRLEINRYIEKWVNQYGADRAADEPLQLVSSSCWNRQIPIPQVSKNLNGKIRDPSSSKTLEQISAEMARILERPSLKISPEMNLATDLGMDSLNIAELTAYLSRHSNAGKIKFEALETVQDVLDAANGSSASAERKKGHFRWPEEKKRPECMLPSGKTVLEAFFSTCKRFGSAPCCADDFVGPITYKKFKTAVSVLGESFKSLPGAHIGVLLPASVSCHIVVLALHFAGKVPVMLNWTLGPLYLDQMMEQSKAEKVISSWNFIDRLANVEFGTLIDKLLFLEDLREQLPLSLKIRGLLGLTKPVPLHEDSPAVILFTSGTESNPKGVPLTHKNVLSNLHSTMSWFPFVKHDLMYSILPPFHSFGFSVLGIFPLCSGVKTAFYPDPTDSYALADGIERWKATHLGSPPSFIRGLFSAAKQEQVQSLKLICSGGELASQEFYQQSQSFCPWAKIIEGYGITECSPLIAAGHPSQPQKGVGRVLFNVDVCTIHPETKELLSHGETGEICVSGPSVFNGYLKDTPSPFIELKGKRWFRTGDLGSVDDEMNLVLSGRLKRFIKLAGEMISLGAIEDTVTKELSPTELPAIVACADELDPGKPRIILFTKVPLDRETANEILKKAGFSPLIKVAQVELVQEIPLLGAGKIDYRRLLQAVKRSEM